MVRTRPYAQTRRAAAVAERRERLVETACALIEEHGFRGLALDAVADAAGVARKTLYNQFGSKRGLLEAVLDAAAQKGGVRRLSEAAARNDARDAAVALIEQSCAFWAAQRPLFRRLIGLAAVDPDVAPAVAERERRREGPWRDVVSRLENERLLRPGITAAEARRVLMHLTSLPAFDALAGDERSRSEVVPILIRLAASVVDLGGSDDEDLAGTG